MIDQKLLPLGLNVATALVVGSVGVASAMLVWRTAGEREADPPRVSLSAAVTQRAPLDLAPILRLAPFGVANAGPMAASGGDGLTLRGVMLARPHSASSAVIGGPDGKAQTVVIGEALSDGSVLQSVTADTATLRTGAGLRILSFGKAAPHGGVAAILAGMPVNMSSARSPIAPASPPVPIQAPPPPPPPPSQAQPPGAPGS